MNICCIIIPAQSSFCLGQEMTAVAINRMSIFIKVYKPRIQSVLITLQIDEYFYVKTDMAKNEKGNKAFLKILVSIAAMCIIGVILLAITMHWIEKYTMHGQSIQVPDVCGMYEEEAGLAFSSNGLQYEISDIRYDESLESGQIIEQSPKAGANVKQGRTVYLTVNSGNQPMKPIPDLAGNSSLRAAKAQLSAAGFRLTEPELVDGDLDWVYGIKYLGNEINAGTMVPEGSTLTIIAGNGLEAMELEPADSSEIIQSDFFDF